MMSQKEIGGIKMPPYLGKTHYFKSIDPISEDKIKKVTDFFAKESLTYYELEGPKIREEHNGQSRYIDITVSIKLS